MKARPVTLQGVNTAITGPIAIQSPSSAAARRIHGGKLMLGIRKPQCGGRARGHAEDLYSAVADDGDRLRHRLSGHRLAGQGSEPDPRRDVPATGKPETAAGGIATVARRQSARSRSMTRLCPRRRLDEVPAGAVEILEHRHDAIGFVAGRLQEAHPGG